MKAKSVTSLFSQNKEINVHENRVGALADVLEKLERTQGAV
jgi:hypothetical protein